MRNNLKPSVAYLYNPHEQSKEQLIQSFVVRRKLFQQLFREIKARTTLHIQFLAKVYLWNNQIKNSINTMNELLTDTTFLDEYTWHLNEYLMLLLAKQQYQYAAEYFELPDLDLKERFKPVYYALLYLTKDPNYHKLPSELAEPVEDIIGQIKQMAVDYE